MDPDLLHLPAGLARPGLNMTWGKFASGENSFKLGVTLIKEAMAAFGIRMPRPLPAEGRIHHLISHRKYPWDRCMAPEMRRKKSDKMVLEASACDNNGK